MKLIHHLILVLIISLQFLAINTSADELSTLAVQDGGRIKPYDSFARETLSLIYGKQKYEGRKASEIVLTWMISPSAWKDIPVFEVRNHDLLKSLNLPSERKYFTGKELFESPQFSVLMQELQSFRETKEKLTPYFQALQRIESQFVVFSEMAQGRLLRVSPNPNSDVWYSVSELPEELQVKFFAFTKSFVEKISTGVVADKKSESAAAEIEMNEKIRDFKNKVKEMFPDKYINEGKLNLEVSYNTNHPFRIAYILYLIAGLLLLVNWVKANQRAAQIALVFSILGFLTHTIGFGVRVYLTGHAPVTNMYETVVWVSWGVMLFSFILEKIYKFKFILMVGCFVGLFSLIIADSAPAILDASLQPLEAVLRSNFWLTTHVMTITISYAAFFLAFGLSDMGLIYYIIDDQKHHEKIRMIVLSVYRAIQIGVMFLAPGIILGGIWADYSWGRFWGWDPKETWALIALLGYVAVLHARIAGMIKNLGMLVCGVVSFNLVIMAWYGVNFVLGAGLHSYGFGAGGVQYVGAFCFAHLMLVTYVTYLQHQRQKLKK